MVQKIHPRGVILDPNFAPYVERFQILELLSKCSILEPSLDSCTTTELSLWLPHSDLLNLGGTQVSPILPVLSILLVLTILLVFPTLRVLPILPVLPVYLVYLVYPVCPVLLQSCRSC